MKKLQKKRKGFTLIELVVVIVIIAILAAVALLSFGNFTNTAKDSRIKQEHAQLITAGNMWRATQVDPTDVPPDLEAITAYFESSKPIMDAHVYTGGVLTSTLSDNNTTLTYDFAAVNEPTITPQPGVDD